MKNVLHVAISHSTKDLVEKALHLWRREPPRLLHRVHDVLEVPAVQELKDQGELLVRVDDIVETHNVRVAQLFEQRNLAHGGHGHTLGLIVESDLLECDELLALRVLRLVDDPVGALSNLLNVFVLL